MAAAAAAGALAIGMAPVARADDTWGAIAISPDSTRWGLSNGQQDQGSARTVAAYKCMGNGPGCNGNVTTFTDCGVLFRNGNSLFTATGATKEDAESAAQKQTPGSTEVSWACNNPPASGPTSYRG
ncbi:DUF4189 domain-containing protein [Mycobacterium palustre]|nr:DUF4189 domain-containing protein [Mycobacterium palustre]